MKIALIQFNASADKADNIRRAQAFIKEAISKKAAWILLPEIFSFRGNLQKAKILEEAAETIPGPTTKIFQEIALKEKTHLLLGSLLEKSDGNKAYNTSVALSPSSEAITKYRKIHLFDAALGDKIIHESNFLMAGSQVQLVNVEEFKVGLSICYDLRFPNLYQNYAHHKADVLTVPSCFTKITGQAHWESLLRARAIENLAYVVAPNQVGIDFKAVEAHGHSMVVSPWGEVIACGSPDKEEIVYAEISLDVIKEARKKLPGIIK